MSAPLNLAAVEARNGPLTADGFVVEAPNPDVIALLAHCRALRAALQSFVQINGTAYVKHPSIVPYHSQLDYDRAAAALGAATDE